jgi:hypothetical protein
VEPRPVPRERLQLLIFLRAACERALAGLYDGAAVAGKIDADFCALIAELEVEIDERLDRATRCRPHSVTGARARPLGRG